MVAQGCADRSRDFEAPRFRASPALGLCLLFSLMGLGSSAFGADADLRLRIAWGGGAPRTLQATLSLKEGRILGAAPLGVEADVPGSAWIDDDGVAHLAARSPRTFSGIDLSLSAPVTASLSVDLAPNGAGEAKHFEFPINELISGVVTRPLDEKQGGQIVARRVPGDKLRVELARDSLVFSPGETFSCRVIPHLVDLAPGSSIRLEAKLVPARGTQVLWSQQEEPTVSAEGTIPPIDKLELTVPRNEGVYDVILSLSKWQLKAPFLSPSLHAERRIQLVVIDPRAPAAPQIPPAWHPVAEIDPTTTNWWSRLPSWSLLPGGGKGALGNQKAEAVILPSTNKNAMVTGRDKFIKLEPAGWQAYPLTVERTDAPHLLEVEYPADLSQTLAISIVEPNAAGKVAPPGLDSGIEVGEPAITPTGPPMQVRRGVYRLAFWPRTKTPVVLFVNRRSEGAAHFGTIRLLAGPDDLPAPAIALPQDKANPRRSAVVAFDRPFLAENFGAAEAFDAEAGRTLDDWLTFYQSTRRLVQYLKYSGANAAVVPVYSEGSTLYPSKLLEPTPRHDSGAFFTTGQDPVRKDVLEMMLRLFDREGLQLITAIQFATPLPALEDGLRRDAASAAGITWIGSDGRSLLERSGASRGLAPYYNPLDERVQQAMLDVVTELTARCQSHPAWGGVSLQLGPETFSQLPGMEWGFDDKTVARFARETTTSISGEGTDRFAARADLLTDKRRNEWIEWRAATMARFHRKLQSEIDRGGTSARLYLDPGEMMRSPQLSKLLRPALPRRGNLALAFRELGLDPTKYSDAPNIVLWRPYRLVAGQPLASQGASLELATNQEIDRMFLAAKTTGSVAFHEPQQLLLPGFDAVSPFGKDNTLTWQFSTMAPAGERARQRMAQALAALDPEMLVDEGWVVPFGQEETQREFLSIYTQLPAERFETVTPAPWDIPLGSAGRATSTQPIVFRSLVRGNRTWHYLVNPSPWEIGVSLEVQVPANASFQSWGGETRQNPQSLGDTRQNVAWQRGGRGLNGKLEMPPFSLAAIVVEAPQAKILRAEVNVAAGVSLDLQARITALGARVDRLAQLQPRVKLPNAGFETPALSATAIPGWIFKQDPRVIAANDATKPYEGKSSLHLDNRSNSPAWIRSDSLPPTRTGRLAFSAWLKTTDTEKPPVLRLCVEARWHGSTYYRFATLGDPRRAGDSRPSAQLKGEWTQFLFQVDDLPAQGVSDLRIGFDLMSTGQVWIDDVQCTDLPFDDNERTELSKMIGLANFQLGQGQVGDCHQTLLSYWPSFLAQNVPVEAPLLARQDPAAGPKQPIPPPPMPVPPTPAPAPTWIERIRGTLPSWR